MKDCRNTHAQIAITLGQLLYVNTAFADPILYCPCQPMTWHQGASSAVVEAYNAERRYTSVISGLDFELMESRSHYVLNNSYIQGDERATKYEIEDKTLARALQIGDKIVEFYRSGAVFDAKNNEIFIDPLQRSYLDDFGNASFAYTASRLTPVLRSELLGHSLIEWGAGGYEFSQRFEFGDYFVTRLRYIANFLPGVNLAIQDQTYSQGVALRSSEFFGRALENDSRDNNVIRESQSFVKFFENRGLAYSYITYWNSSTVDADDLYFPEFEYKFLDNYGKGREETDSYLLSPPSIENDSSD